MALQEHEKDLLVQKAKTNADIIRSIPPGQSNPLTGHEKVKARAEPNQRLVGSFGIDNVFTDTDHDSVYRTKFVGTTILKMKAATQSTEKGAVEDWRELRSAVLAHVEEYLRHHPGEVNLAELIQFVTLKISLEYLFEDAKSAMARRSTDHVLTDITYIARRINQLWLDSKETKGVMPQWENETELHTALRAVTTFSGSLHIPGGFSENPTNFGEDDVDPLEPPRNPMNLLLPAYETMWRVVIRCVLEVQYRGSQDALDWRKILFDYLEDLKSKEATQGAFEKVSRTEIAPIDVAKEAIRLYPPSRHVHRLFTCGVVKAEIEETQRSPLFGDNAAGLFDPKRWQKICPELRSKVYRGESQAARQLKAGEEKLGFMPFAFVCTADTKATGSFGLKMIALLTAAIISKLDDTWQLKDAETELPPPGVALRTDREAYSNLILLGPSQDQSSCLVQ
jgi:hypothetical protein